MKPMTLSPPIIFSPVHNGGKAVAITGHLAGANVKVFRKAMAGNLDQIWLGVAPQVQCFNCILSQKLAWNDKVYAVQDYKVGSQVLKSADPPSATYIAAYPTLPLLVPYLTSPLYTCARAIRVGNIVNGAMVEVYLNGARIFQAPIGAPNLGIGVKALKTGDVLYAVQYFPDIKPATSAKYTVTPYPNKRLPKPIIKKPLLECAPSFEVEGLVLGATLFVSEKTSNTLIAEQVVDESTASIHLEKGLKLGWTLVASQQLCGASDLSPDSTAVKVEEIACIITYPPTIAAKMTPGDSFIVVNGLHESTIRVLADGKDIGGGTCYGTTAFYLDPPLTSAKILLVQSLDCRKKVWEVNSIPVHSAPGDEVIELDEKNFNSMINKSSLPMMIDFWAKWCHTCLTVMPKVEQIAKDYAGKAIIAKCNIDLYNPYKDNAIPKFRFYKKSNPTPVMTVSGWDETKLRSELNTLIGP